MAEPSESRPFVTKLSPEPPLVESGESSNTSRKGRRERLVVVVKVVATSLLLGWLLRSGTLELDSLSLLVRSPRVLFSTLALWFAVPFLMNTLRWRVVLGMVGERVPLPRALALQTMAQFFNIAVPGNVGGDVLKNYYIMPRRPGAIVSCALMERYVGLLALFLVGVAFSVFSDDLPGRSTEAVFVLGIVAAGMSLGLLVVVFAVRRRESLRVSSKTSLVAKLLGIVGSFEQQGLLRASVISLVLSALMHLGSFSYFTLIAHAMSDKPLPIVALAAIYPLGMATVVLPVSVAGLGVGHLAFEQLFRWVGLEGGANIFNVFILGVLAPNVVGIIPYWLLRADRSRSS